MSYVVQSKTGSSYLEYIAAQKVWSWDAGMLIHATKFPTHVEACNTIAGLPQEMRDAVGRIFEWPVKHR